MKNTIFVDEQLCHYDSKLQPLPSIYEKTLGWQVASRMKYNMAFDHDSIAANHDKPDIAFMVWSRRKIEKREYNQEPQKHKQRGRHR